MAIPLYAGEAQDQGDGTVTIPVHCGKPAITIDERHGDHHDASGATFDVTFDAWAQGAPLATPVVVGELTCCASCWPTLFGD
jgi:hypothetical protein